MIFIPVSTDLEFSGRPWITLAVIALCLVIYNFQAGSKQSVRASADYFCAMEQTVFGSSPDESSLLHDADNCSWMLEKLHSRPKQETFLEAVRYLVVSEYPQAERSIDQEFKLILRDYDRFSVTAPTSLDAKLLYDPTSWNPFRMILSSVSHGDWMHVGFNLVFFFAFAAALELLIGNAWRYIGLMVLIAVTTGLVDSFFSLFKPYAVPSYGLSGVVMGMIGLSAYLMPRARVRTVIGWLGLGMKSFYIPAWILAVFYIGGDTWQLLSDGNSGGVNVLAHVSGGFAGYFIGYLWFSQRRDDIKDELETEIEFRRKKRGDKMGVYSHHDRHSYSELDMHAGRKRFSEFLEQLHRLATTKKDGEAIVLVFADYNEKHDQPEYYEDLLQEMMTWPACRTQLCVARHAITLLLAQRRYERALKLLAICQRITPRFELADAATVLQFSRIAVESQQYDLALKLVHDAQNRYGGQLDVAAVKLQEARILVNNTDRKHEAVAVLRELLAIENNPYRTETEQLVRQVQLG